MEDRPQSVRSRLLAGFFAGAVIYLSTLYRGLSYTDRARMGGRDYLIFAVLMLAAGFAVTLRMQRAQFVAVTCMLVGVFASHTAVIIADCRVDPSDHNLLPFEFVLLGILALPAYVGALGSGFLVKRHA